MTEAQNRSLYMLDTNVSSGVMKGKLPAIEAKLKALPTDQWCISAITRMEHRYGVALAKSTRIAAAVERFLELVPVAPWDSAAADKLGWLRVVLRSSGKPIGVYDEMIAAHALALDAVLLTLDSDFDRVPGLKRDTWDERHA